MLQRLPVGIQTFSELREGNYLYVDKTEAILRLITQGKYFFLSRPRRFGKSLLLSTIKSIYQGRRDLFSDLWIAQQRDWSKVNPVIHLSFASISYRELGLEEAIRVQLQATAAEHGVSFTNSDSISRMFAELLEKLADQHGKVVVLIDEYDKPLIDYLDDIPLAKANQQVMKTFYSVIKDSDPYIEFLLITGVSKFSRVSLFSDLNNLYDLTLDLDFANLLGYTQTELIHYFTPYLPAVMQRTKLDEPALWAKIQEWYNGYTWDLETAIYNPFSILNFFQAKAFRNFWFETGTPTFLPKLMRREKVYRLDDLDVVEAALGNYDIERLQLTPVLFQTGYLTLKSRDEYGLYRLDYPNHEVQASMTLYLMAEWAHEEPARTTPMVIKLHKAFLANDMEAVIDIIKTVFKKIPYPIFIQDREAYYHSLIYLTFFYLGQFAEAEVNESNARVDCVVKTPAHIYVIEFKLDETAQVAMRQIKSRDYAGAFRDDPRPKVLLGINFSSRLKSVDDWLVENA
ncbi:ATP-binding protein [Thiothrix subterranea]|uniref:AAA family ATPase n=1 Tax=Thiothrix subterranea TaxID=2735563 RepID=A0ABU0Y7P3_9GAMM|nr:AAA family ATPase [Thiothrix subterranea]MDQ5768790.1 AAA family ATPase [Thiothrix subterranea]